MTGHWSATLTSSALGRGKCYSAKAGNIGMVLRRSVVQGLSSLQQPDVNLCCQGMDAPPKVSLLFKNLGSQREVHLCCQGTDAPSKFTLELFLFPLKTNCILFHDAYPCMAACMLARCGNASAAQTPQAWA